MRSFTATLGFATAFASVTTAHSLFTNIIINDNNQGDGTCVRMPKDPSTATDPIAGLDSPDMACGRDGENAVAYTCPAPAGSKITFEWRLNPDYSAPGSIDISHKGPCAVYLKQVADIQSTPAVGDGWFKIWDDGYDESTQKWCTEKLIDNNGLMSVELPSGLPGGYYLVRPELLALHEADKGDPQFYVGCGQLFVDGPAGTLDIPAQDKVSIPGYVTTSEKSTTFNVWKTPMDLPYPIPGPEVYTPTAPAGSVSQVQAASVPLSDYKQPAQGAVPTDCLLKVDNWCGTEVPSYSDAKGCDAAAQSCNTQLNDCYKSAGPTGSAGCKQWEAKCGQIQASCQSDSPSGPPNQGQKLASPDKPLPGAIPAAEPVSSGEPAKYGPAATPAAAQNQPAASQPTYQASAPQQPAPQQQPVQPAQQQQPAQSAQPQQPAQPAQPVQPAPQQPAQSAQPAQPAPQQPAPQQPAPSSENKPVLQQPAPSQQPAAPVAPAAPATPTTLATAQKAIPTATAVPAIVDTGFGPRFGTGPKVAAPSAVPVPAMGRCGAAYGGQTCKGNALGECCSKSGFCGSTRFHCGAGSSSTQGCQGDYGVCKQTKSTGDKYSAATKPKAASKPLTTGTPKTANKPATTGDKYPAAATTPKAANKPAATGDKYPKVVANKPAATGDKYSKAANKPVATGDKYPKAASKPATTGDKYPKAASQPVAAAGDKYPAAAATQPQAATDGKYPTSTQAQGAEFKPQNMVAEILSKLKPAGGASY